MRGGLFQRLQAGGEEERKHTLSPLVFPCQHIPHTKTVNLGVSVSCLVVSISKALLNWV